MIIGLENQFPVFLRVAVLHRFYCKSNMPGEILSGFVFKGILSGAILMIKLEFAYIKKVFDQIP